MNIKWKKWAVLALFLSVPFLSGGTMGEGCSKPVELEPVVEIPSAPSNLQATRLTCTSIKLAWHYNYWTAPEGFNVYRKCDNGEYELIAVTDSNPFTDTDVPEGVQCTYYITAFNSGGESQASNEASG